MEWINKIFGIKPKPPIVNYWEMRREMDLAHDKMMQEFEDNKIARWIKNRASELLMEYENATIIHVGNEEVRMFLPLHKGIIYNIHSMPDAKYKDVDISKLIYSEFEKLRDAH